jgi:eukaryotic-like serine/threonine-protein kinase
MNLENGSIINQYKIISAIGKGGMGEVFLAQDTKLDRKVALKILPPEFAEDKDRMSRFVREAKSASALNHPNIITIHEIGESDGTHFIATEFIEGETLSKHLRGENVSLKSVLDIASQIASALQTAHSAGIVHRDIKPDNVMIRADGLAKILDFGIAKLSETPTNIGEDDATAIQKPSTSPGMIIGTANYMSPEQAKGKEIDARSDIFSFGIVFYEMLTGKRAFEGETALESISSILKDEPQPISRFLPEVPNEIERIVNKTLRKDREERYQTAKDLLIDLKDAKQSLELQNLMERSIVPNQDENKTQILKATTLDEINQTTTNQTVTGNSKTKYLTAGLLTLLLTVGGFFGYKYLSPTKQIESIAVMPFVNESKNEEVEYLSDGMTETLISSLSNIPNLSVKARSTVFYYKGKETSPQKIGEELKVQAVLLGRVSQRGDDLKLSLELVNTQTQDVIWSETYNRKQSDLVSLQSEIAKTVSDKLRLKLTASEQERVSKTNTTSSEAQQLYLKGRFHWNKRNTEDFQKAREYFQQAIAVDPNYALAHTGLADTLALMPYYGNFRPSEYMPLAKQSAQKALEIDPNLAEAHASLGQILLNYDYDFKGAERELKRAIELDPKYPSAYQWLSEVYHYQGNGNQALSEINKALELDPLALVINNQKGRVLNLNGKRDEAVAQFKKTIELFPDSPMARNNLRFLYEANGMYSEAFEQVIAQNKRPERIKDLQLAFEKDGYKGYVQKKLDEQLDLRRTDLEKDKNSYLKSFEIALNYTRLQDKDKALEYLNKAYEQREPQMAEIKVTPPFVFLRDDPRFKELVRQVGIPE